MSLDELVELIRAAVAKEGEKPEIPQNISATRGGGDVAPPEIPANRDTTESKEK